MNVQEMQNNAERVSGLLKSMSHEGRLMILCLLIGGEKSVGEIARSLEMRDAAASQQLALLRKDGLTKTRREGQTVYYSVSRDDVRQLIEFLYVLYCEPKKEQDT
jgi:ArsR family transcriptional regulator, virulence genes transcriptional regulator